MRHNQFLKMFAWLTVLSVTIIGNAFAQVPSLVTQQERLSTGGATPSYVQLRAKAGVASSANFYAWDQAPVPTAGVNYSLFLDANNNIERSDQFGLAQKNFLMAVNATGNGLQWVDPLLLLTFNNALTRTGNLVQFGGPLIKATSVDQAGFNLSFINSSATATATTFGDGTHEFDINMDVGATGTMIMKNIAADITAPNILALDATGKVRTRSFSTLVTADNGLIATGSLISMGGPTAAAAAPLLTNRFIGLASFGLNYTGSGNFNVGDGAGTVGIKLDPGAAGSIQMKNVANFATPTASDRFVMLDPTGAAGDKVWTRSLSSLVNANNGLIVDNAVTPGTSTVQLGAPATGGSLLLTDRFIGLSTHALNFEGSGSVNVGTTGNANLNVNTGATGNMTLQGTTLNVGAGTPGFDNIAFVDAVSHNVRDAKTTDLTVNGTPTMFITVDGTGKITKSVSPTTGFTKGQIAGTGTYTYTSPAINILAGASITCTVENHTGINGAVIVQVTNVTTGAAGTFSVETSENIQPGSFIDYVVMN